MGTHTFFRPPRPIQASGLNMEARANAAGGYASRIAGGAAQKDIAAARAVAQGPHGTTKDAASSAPGPKRT